jgi:hypothetical protein
LPVREPPQSAVINIDIDSASLSNSDKDSKANQCNNNSNAIDKTSDIKIRELSSKVRCMHNIILAYIQESIHKYTLPLYIILLETEGRAYKTNINHQQL